MMRAVRLLMLSICRLAAAAVKNDSPGGRGCQLDIPGYASGLHHVRIQVEGQARIFLLFVPTAYMPHVGVPLWLLAPGAYETPGRFLHVSGMLQFAEANGFAFAVLQGVRIEGMNVGLHTRALPYLPDDVEYTRAILRDVSKKVCVNMDRIRCTGYSRGARFCSRLASELSNFVGGIAPVAGLRFPDPNNSTRPMPIIAIHGTKDAINPYWGQGDPSYWHSSVPDAVNKWSANNQCKYSRWVRKTEHVVYYEHYDCVEDASVVLVMVEGDGHTWPNSNAFVESQFGKTTHEIDANEVVRDFFMRHPDKSHCRTAKKGDLCFHAVQKAMKHGLAIFPDWEQRLDSIETFEDYQYELHVGILADCARPCPATAGSGEEVEFRREEEEEERKDERLEAGSSDRPSITQPVGTVKAIEGRWRRNTQPGRFTEEIKDGSIHWDVGPVTKITAMGNNRYTTQWQGSTYQARLVNGELIWDDGDVWSRADEDDSHPDHSDRDSMFAKKVEDISVDERSLGGLSRIHAVLGLLAVGTTAVIGAAAAFTSLRALRCGRPRETRFQDDDPRGLLFVAAGAI
mmetsp:Transcript_102367/g.305707  ORF Transcript_102367/g.305707 Transcript_102367/m.305707 type:complete len:571 (-) Transcript_102367:259-1971(-)